MTYKHTEDAFTVFQLRYSGVVMGAMASYITSLPIVYSNIKSGADQTKHQISASLVFVREIHRWPIPRSMGP